MKTVKTVEFIFENCESIVIDKMSNFGLFYIGDITEKIERDACNCISKFLISGEVYIEIFKKADGEHYAFGDKENSEKDTIFNRIKYGDITAIVLTYDDDSEEHYYTAYEDESPDVLGSINVNQQVEISELGNLYLVISKSGVKVKEMFEEVFNEETKEEADFREKMISD